MSKRSFTKEEQTLLKESRYTYSVSANTISFTIESKKEFGKRYQTGQRPGEIVQELGITKQHLVSKVDYVLILIIDCNLKITVQRIKELAVSFEYSDLLILGCCGIVNILKTIALGIVVLRNLNNSILCYRHNLYGFLYGFRSFDLLQSGQSRLMPEMSRPKSRYYK